MLEEPEVMQVAILRCTEAMPVDLKVLVALEVQQVRLAVRVENQAEQDFMVASLVDLVPEELEVARVDRAVEREVLVVEPGAPAVVLVDHAAVPEEPQAVLAPVVQEEVAETVQAATLDCTKVKPEEPEVALEEQETLELVDLKVRSAKLRPSMPPVAELVFGERVVRTLLQATQVQADRAAAQEDREVVPEELAVAPGDLAAVLVDRAVVLAAQQPEAALVAQALPMSKF